MLLFLTSILLKRGFFMSLEPWMIWAGLVIIVLLLIISIPVALYNKLIVLRNRIDQAFGAIDISLERRFDALTNMAEVLAKYTDHESEVYSNVAKMRSGYQGQTNDEKVKKSNEASRFVSGLRIQREAYPQLKADKQFLHLEKSINEFEERIAATRRTYNARVTKYNNLTQKFPTVILATILGFSSKELLQAPEEKKENVDLGSILRG